MINHKLNNKAKSPMYESSVNIVGKCCWCLCDFKTILLLHRPSRKSMIQTIFILDEFNVDF